MFNQVKHYGEWAYLTKGNETEVGFILRSPDTAPSQVFEVKHHPVQGDLQKLQRMAKRYDVERCWLIGRYPMAGFQEFRWGGLIFGDAPVAFCRWLRASVSRVELRNEH